jgi:hypothetical protein
VYALQESLIYIRYLNGFFTIYYYRLLINVTVQLKQRLAKVLLCGSYLRIKKKRNERKTVKVP